VMQSSRTMLGISTRVAQDAIRPVARGVEKRRAAVREAA
jgi:hypothetical protein